MAMRSPLFVVRMNGFGAAGSGFFGAEVVAGLHPEGCGAFDFGVRRRGVFGFGQGRGVSATFGASSADAEAGFGSLPSIHHCDGVQAMSWARQYHSRYPAAVAALTSVPAVPEASRSIRMKCGA